MIDRDRELCTKAASLLMPSQLLQKHAVGYGTTLLDADVSALAEKFNVSEQAMTIRLSALGLP